ncbi:peroxidasin-like protein [Diaphorina citri]|uniref:Peroxidasin-like protein n=1 Tax=Diaphorina citri TaxID=121845 RepID=A0A1S3D458_DIACI|nr:peroxidasin-like protein [Diaphorina citri]
MSRNSVLSSTLEQCPYNVFLSFQKCLDNSDNWKLFVKSLTILGKELSSLEIDQLDIESRKIGGSPAKYIWFKLQSWLTTTQELITVLRHCQLLDPLLVLVGPEPLEIITHPGSDEEDRFVDHGAKVILTCEAKGLPLPSYQWFHNNQALPKENGTQLCLDNINCDDTGAYYCQVSHTHPDSTEYKLFSHYVNLTVKPPIPRITSQPNELHALHSGRSLMLRIYCVPPPEEVQINWYHNGQLLTGEHSSVLFLENISSQQEGHYLCELSNESGSVFSKDMNVIVVPPPSTLRSHDADDAGDRRASCKMALLIANYTYDNMQNLKTPCK